MKYLLLWCMTLAAAFGSDPAASHGTIDALKIDYSVVATEVDGRLVLRTTLKNRSKNTYLIPPGLAPWCGFAGMNVHVTPRFPVPSDQKWESEFVAGEHFTGAKSEVLQAGGELSGAYDLSLYYRPIVINRSKGDIGVNWNFVLKMQVRKSDELAPRLTDKVMEKAWVGGFLVLWKKP